MLNAVGWAAAILLAACLLRVILNGGRAGADRGGTGGTRRPLELLPLAAVGLTLWHGWLALHGSAFVVLFSLPGYLAAAILLALSLPRLRRAARAALAGNVRGTGSAEPAAAGPVLPSRSAAARVAAVAGLGLLVLSAIRLVELHALRNAATSPPELRRQERVLDLAARSWPDAFAALCADLAVRYPFTAWKGIDWRMRCAATAPRIAAAAAHRDAAAYYGALREFVWSIPDGHVGLAGDDHGLAGRETGGDFGLRLVQLAGGRVVASGVLPGGAAARAGLRYGAEILTWNGKPIGEALAATPVLWADWPPSTAEARRAEQLRFLVRAPVGTVASIAYRLRGAAEPAAALRTVRLTATAPLPAASGKAGGTAPMDPDEPPEGGPVAFNLREAFTGGAVEWRWLPAGAGYIRVKYELPTLCQVDPSGQVRRAVASFLDRRASGIVLDVRGNGGGLDLMVPRAIGCLVDAPGVYEVPGVFSPAAGRFLPAPAYTVRVVPMAPHFAGRVAVLIDGYTLSSGEGFPLALRGRPGVAVFGFVGTGGFFAIDQRLISLPGGLAMVVPIGQSLDAGDRIQVDSDAAGRGGVAPDHLIPWTESTLDAVYREHRDPVLEASCSARLLSNRWSYLMRSPHL
jgi:carboxyl-terminal processing protease